MHFIETLKEGERVSEVYLCKTKQIAKTKAGKTYYSLVLQDRTGQLSAKVWEENNGISHFEVMDYIRVEGEVTVFAGALQLNVRRIRVADPGEYVTGDYLPVSAYNVEEMYRELLSYIDSLKNEKLKSLADAFFRKDPDFIKSFKEHSAAKTVHHGFVGGLLEHTLGVVRLCDYLSVHYPALNRDLLLEREKRNWFFEFDVKEIIRASLKERYDAYKLAHDTGFITVNEIRRMENMHRIEGMDGINVGLGAVLYDVNSRQYYSPNTNSTAKVDDQNEIQTQAEGEGGIG